MKLLNPFLVVLCWSIGFGDAASSAQSLSEPSWQVDLEAARKLWGTDPAIDSAEALHRVRVDLEGRSLWAATQLLGDEELVVLPYADHDDLLDAAGERVARGDGDLARLLPPGEIGLAVRHQRPGHRTLDAGAGPRELMPEVGLRYTHVEVLVGVLREGEPGVISLNSPPAYAGGRFGGADYPMIFFRLDFDAFGEQASEVRRSLRGWLLAYGSLLTFPVQYQGQDPLSASSPERVTLHASRAIQAIAGDDEASEWFREKAHQLYCSEFALLAINTALQHPLTAAEMVPLVGQRVWRSFEKEVSAFSAGRDSRFRLPRSNAFAALVDIRLSEVGHFAAEPPALAIAPMTLVDVLERTMNTLIPPSETNPAAAEARAALLGTLGVQARTRVSLETPEEVARLDDLLERLLALELRAVGEYRPARHQLELRPLLEEAEELLCAPPRGQSCLYAPPALFPWVAAGQWPSRRVRVEYLGHGIHYSLVRRSEGPEASKEEEHSWNPN